MEEGIIFTLDKKDIEVFFLKPQGSFSPHPSEPNTWIVNDEETAKALLEDNMDCCEDLYLMNEQDVNENSAGGGAHGCHTGVKGAQGMVGVREDEADIFEAISECLEKFSVTDLNVNDSGSRDILSITITRKIKNLL